MKGCEFKSRQEQGENFLIKSQLCVLTLIGYAFHPHVTAVAWKDSGHSAESAGGRLHLNMHTPLTQRSRSGLTMPLSRHSVWDLSGNKLAHNSSGKAWSLSSRLAEPLWIDPGLKSGISVHELITALKKKHTQKKHRQQMIDQTFSPNSRKRGKSHHHHHN